MKLKDTFFCIVFGLFALAVSAQYRSIDGSLNNLSNTEWGSAGEQLRQITSNGYEDGISAMSGSNRPNPRDISNRMFAQEEGINDEQNHSDFVWAFGQFIDHDIIQVADDHTEAIKIEIPTDDPIFTPGSSMGMFRSAGMEGSGTGQDQPRRYANNITAFIDGSGVYGSDIERANWLRTFEGGKLKTSYSTEGDLLPWNTVNGEFNGTRDPNAPFMDYPFRDRSKLFIAGDNRANENPLLTTFHTIFVREHNRLCAELQRNNPQLTDEELYQEGRKWVAAYIQKIAYYDWLPSMGITLPAYKGYREDVNAQISNVFSAAAFRMGHTLINSNILRLESGGEEIYSGNISLKDAFFNPVSISLVGGIEPYIRGMASQVQQKLDCKVIEDIRNFLFGGSNGAGMDLAAININRGRERGLVDFNTIRADIGLPRLKTFEELSNDSQVSDHLEEIYGSIDDVDPWVGMLAEEYMPKAMFGMTLMTILEEQFQILRDGDRYYFEADESFSETEKNKIFATSLRDIIMRNTGIKIMQDNVFEAMETVNVPTGPSIEPVSLEAAVYPNPIFDRTTIKVYSEDQMEVSISVFNNEGRLIDRFSELLVEGDNFIPLDLSNELGATSYNVMISKNDIEFSIVRVIKL